MAMTETERAALEAEILSSWKANYYKGKDDAGKLAMLERRQRDKYIESLVNDGRLNYIPDGVYDCDGCNVIGHGGSIEGIEELSDLLEFHGRIFVASAYEVGTCILFDSMPTRVKTRGIGIQFNYGATALIQDAPKNLLILAEND